MQGKDMPGVNGGGPMWKQLNNEPPDSPTHYSDDELMLGYRDRGMESLDYEVVESVAYREDQAQRGIWHHASYVTLKWTFALLIGIGTGLAAFFINIAVENFSGWKFAATFAVMKHSYFLGLVVYIACNGALVFSSVYIVTQFAPAAAGSGIPEIKAYLNGVDTPGILLFRTLIGKILGSIGSVGGGLALGKEGPLVHTGACIASVLGQGGSTKYNANWRWLRRFKNDRDRRDLVTCGCAAGVAAAFRSPVGGVLFALEEVTSWWRSQLLWRVFFTSAVVAIVVRTAMGWCKNGKCGHFSSGGFIIWDISGGQDDYSFYELLPMAMLGAIGGLLGALFNQLTIWISTWRRNVLHRQGNRVMIIEVLLVSLITSILSFGLPMMTTCKPCPDPAKYPDVTCPLPSSNYGNYVNFFCSNENEYNDLATIFFNTQDDAIRNLFSTNTPNEYTTRSLLTFLVMFFSLAVLTFGTAVPSGQFVPGIMIGATYGRLVGILVVNASRKNSVDEGTYALLGAASFLGGSMRMTVSLCVIMVEITNNLQLLPLIMLVLLISKAVGDAFNNGFYEEQVKLRSLPLLESRPQRFMRTLAAKDAISTRKVVQFSRVSKVSQIVAVLRSTDHNGFPVVDNLDTGEPVVIGLILRSYLLVLLQAKTDFQHNSLPGDIRGQISFRYNMRDFTKPVSSKGLSIYEINISPQEMDMYIDLQPFVNPTPYIVPEDMSLTKVYNLFRLLGLRHICVVPRPSQVVGVITRKDLLPEVLEEKNGLEELMSSRGRYFLPHDRNQPLLEDLM
ncbi:chloride channel protein CLC-d [Physcomitrium patens]|uniref:Chloride channel protein n=1 Tax=Physcomitrium patens TaxID=3218 RepID=A9SYH1_PHYPA|nr:chloride channel protein CLC-d-like isoform X1 [Physcomitrium patens]XP_024361603.1 chloride channel protein CLC-d-like isoform X1 [Physcomitrium patens]XP_024361604.1 chloride channel protein CLC-d-like isoform X1 [Physcomitrium patens]XP_024361605.1 chloride channel protein CLC-d-like isoform X1 [Physcomitrium patens]XP_024361606.1 chloride channel protein CLC-d-like isoform X1 [Physcomitrium patens]XP_024361608.1 chloride channel protein CLC-d-like isoform X1 [Physcomitrium patens]PNR29|eukprot:XP_024361602.1 chloride channel protein CLC-d-like isoform X1 [Physcomitrella patens]